MIFAKKDWSEKEIAFLREYLYSLRDEQYRSYSKKMVKTQYNIIGVRTPSLVSIAKEISKGDAEQFLKVFVPGSHEEMLLKAAVIGAYGASFRKKKPFIKDLLGSVDNWAVCDSLAMLLNPRTAELPEVLGFAQFLIKGTKEFERRFAIELILNYFINEKFIDSSLDFLKSVKDDRNTVCDAISTAVSMCYIKFPEKTTVLLKAKVLNRNVQNKVILKVTQSLRATPEEKEAVTQWKM